MYGYKHPIIKRFLIETGFYNLWKKYNLNRCDKYKEFHGIDTVFGLCRFTDFLKYEYDSPIKVPDVITSYNYSISTIFRVWLMINYYDKIVSGEIGLSGGEYYNGIALTPPLIIYLEEVTNKKLDVGALKIQAIKIAHYYTFGSEEYRTWKNI